MHSNIAVRNLHTVSLRRKQRHGEEQDREGEERQGDERQREAGGGIPSWQCNPPSYPYYVINKERKTRRRAREGNRGGRGGREAERGRWGDTFLVMHSQIRIP